MDLVKSHISGQPFLYPVPHLPTYCSILLRISREFSSGCMVYIRPCKDVASTEISLAAAQTGPSPSRRTGPASIFFTCHQNQTFLGQLVQLGHQSWPSSTAWPALQFYAMDTATQVTLLVLVVATAGVSQALYIEGSPDKDGILLGSEENMPDSLLGLVRRKYSKISLNSPLWKLNCDFFFFL